jgi:hypothetical protein
VDPASFSCLLPHVLPLLPGNTIWSDYRLFHSFKEMRRPIFLDEAVRLNTVLGMLMTTIQEFVEIKKLTASWIKHINVHVYYSETLKVATEISTEGKILKLYQYRLQSATNTWNEQIITYFILIAFYFISVYCNPCSSESETALN